MIMKVSGGYKVYNKKTLSGTHHTKRLHKFA